MFFQYIDSLLTGLINLRNCFTKTLIGSIKDKKLYTYSYSELVPFQFYKPILEEPYVYKLNDKFHISDNKFTVIPLIKNVIVKNDNDQEEDITERINNYDNSFELWLVLLLEKLTDYNTIIIKINRIITEEILEFNIDDIKYNKLYEIYNNKINKN
jgi:hypothetical protein